MKHYYEAPNATIIALNIEENLLNEPGANPGTQTLTSGEPDLGD